MQWNRRVNQTKWPAKKQPRAPGSLKRMETVITPKNWNTANTKLCKIGFFPQLIRKHLALPAMCMCFLNNSLQRARIWRGFVVCAHWGRKAQGRRSQLDHPPHWQSNWWCQLSPAWWNRKNTAFAASKADFMVLYSKRVPGRILSAVKFFLGLPTHGASIKISSEGIQSTLPTLWNRLQFLPSLMKWYTVVT